LTLVYSPPNGFYTQHFGNTHYRSQSKDSPVCTMKAYWGSGCIAPFILYLSISWGWEVNFVPQPLYAQKGGAKTFPKLLPLYVRKLLYLFKMLHILLHSMVLITRLLTWHINEVHAYVIHSWYWRYSSDWDTFLCLRILYGITLKLYVLTTGGKQGSHRLTAAHRPPIPQDKRVCPLFDLHFLR